MKKENYEQEFAKEKTKKSLKKSVAITMASAICGIFAGCALPTTDSSGGGSSVDPQKPPVTPVENEIPQERIDDFVGKLALGNYTFELKTDEGTVSYLIDGDAMFTYVNDEWGVYYVYENGKMVKLVYDQSIDKYYKYNETKLLSLDSIVYDTLVATNWKEYDKANDVVSGTSGTIDFALNLTNKTITGDIEGKIYDVSNTQVLMPTYIVDKTNEVDPNVPTTPVDPTPVEPTVPTTPTETKNIYEIVNGEYVFNVALMRDVLLNWMKGDNQFGKDFVAAIRYDDKCVTDDVIFVNASKDKLEFGYIYHDDSNKYFVSKAFNDQNLYTKIASGAIKTKTEFEDYLNSLTVLYNINNTRDMVTIDTTVSDSDFKTLTERVFKRLEEKGVQGSSVNNDYPETKLEDFSKAEVLYGFKGPTSSGAGFDLGWMDSWMQYYLIKYNGNVEFVSIAVEATDHATMNFGNIIENVENKWMISSITRSEINRENEQIYDVSTTTAMNAIYFDTEKRRELI